jgi:L-fucose isomerase-like protein
MEFTIVFTAHGEAIYVDLFKPGLRYLDEARKNLGKDIKEIEIVNFFARDQQVDLDEETARRMGELFAEERNTYVYVPQGFINKYLCARCPTEWSECD